MSIMKNSICNSKTIFDKLFSSMQSTDKINEKLSKEEIDANIKTKIDNIEKEVKNIIPKALSDLTDDEYKKYLNTVNPDTQKPYIIPMLTIKSDNYYNKYVEYMILREYNPDLFNTIITWQ